MKPVTSGLPLPETRARRCAAYVTTCDGMSTQLGSIAYQEADAEVGESVHSGNGARVETGEVSWISRNTSELPPAPRTPRRPRANAAPDLGDYLPSPNGPPFAISA